MGAQTQRLPLNTPLHADCRVHRPRVNYIVVLYFTSHFNCSWSNEYITVRGQIKGGPNPGPSLWSWKCLNYNFQYGALATNHMLRHSKHPQLKWRRPQAELWGPSLAVAVQDLVWTNYREPLSNNSSHFINCFSAWTPETLATPLKITYYAVLSIH